MAKVTIMEASKLVNISRSHFYKKYIQQGLISIAVENGKKLIDTSELVRVFGSIHIKNTGSKDDEIEKQVHNDKIIALLERQLQEAKEMNEWLKIQLEKTTHMLENSYQKRKKFLGLF